MIKLRFWFIVLFLVVIVISLVLSYFYIKENRVFVQVNESVNIKEIEDNTISKVEAEIRNLNATVLKSDNPSFKKYNDQESLDFKKTFKITHDSVLKISEVSNGVIPTFFLDENLSSIENQILIDRINATIYEYNLEELDIDVSIINISEDINKLVDSILGLQASRNFKLHTTLPIKWSNNFDYTYLSAYSRFYNQDIDLNIFSTKLTTVKVELFGYTTLNSSSPGPITELRLAEASLQYYIKEGIPRDKLISVINTLGYKWGNRSYANTFYKNFVLPTKQVELIGSEQLNSLISLPTSSITQNFENLESLLKTEDINGVNFIVYPQIGQIEKLIEISKSYGINGYILNNYYE